MRWLDALVRRRSLERQLDAELRFHLEQQVKDKIAAGVSPDEARRQARFEFGGVDQMKEACRDVRPLRIVEGLVQDLRYGCRTMFEKRGFTAVVVLTIALGIGSSTLVFSVVNAVLLRPLPYEDPEQLVWMWARSGFSETAAVSAGDFRDYRRENRSFAALGATFYATLGMNLTCGPQPERVQAAMVSADFFDVLSVAPLLGRGFQPRDEQVDVPASAVLSYGLWHRLYGAKRDVLGDTLRLDGEVVTIVGVMPSGLRFQHDADLWVPMPLALPETQARSWRGLRLVGRLHKDVTLAQAQREMDLIAARLEQQYPVANAGYSLRLEPLRDVVLGDVHRPLMLLMAAVGLLLVIACANVATLVLSRGTARRRELATRAALGAGRLHLARLLIAEAVVFALAGGACGMLLALWGVRVLRNLHLDAIPRLAELSVDPHVLLFALALTLSTVLVFGLLPAIQTSGLSAMEALRASTGTVGLRQSQRMSRALVISELAIGLMLLVAGGLAARSLANLLAVDPGFNPSHALTLPITVSRGLEAPARKAFFVDLLDRVEQIPGVRTAGMISELPLTAQRNDVYFHVEGSAPASPDERVTVDYRRISPGYFRAMEIPLLRGRLFTSTELSTSAPVAIVDKHLVEMFFQGKDPLGQRLVVGEGDTTTFEIVGVVGSVLHRSLHGRPYQTMYVPDVESFPSMTLVLRTTVRPEDVVGTLRASIAAIDNDVPTSNIATLDEIVFRDVSGSRFGVLFLNAFSALGLVLAVVGLYGVLAFSTTRRTQEIAVRMALGSHRRSVLRLVVAEGMKLWLVGMTLGLAGAYALGRFMQSLLFGIGSTDSMTFALAIIVLAATSLLASYVPARRAAAIDPARALRQE
ncbi:MAG: FtsX-like permease family protein [Luteitalea sp.]|nr:FtsX-like permease family protein [Luteitalea sp.]